jgi:hypothetical protein
MADRKLQNMRGPRSTTLADLLERILDTGIVVAGDIKVNLNDVELLTVQIRLVICSVDKADQMGLDWWKSANYLQSNPQSSPSEPDAGEAVPAATQEQFEALNDRLGRLEQTMGRLAAQAEDGDDGA